MNLLLSLAEKNEIDIYDIPIAQLTKSYMDEIQKFPADMEGMSEFLLMAATLLEIKSRMLIPRNKTEEIEDPRAGLVQQLIEYKKFQEIATVLGNISFQGERVFKKPDYDVLNPEISRRPSLEECLGGITLDMLHQVFTDCMKRKAVKTDTVRHKFNMVNRETFTIEDKIKHIKNHLQEHKYVLMSDLFVKCANRNECIITFLALLELIKLRQVQANQDKIFGEIEVYS